LVTDVGDILKERIEREKSHTTLFFWYTSMNIQCSMCAYIYSLYFLQQKAEKREKVEEALGREVA
jgi:hypothetical protein